MRPSTSKHLLLLTLALLPQLLAAQTADSLTIIGATPQPVATSRIARLSEARREAWMGLIPRQAIAQAAGNIGIASVGVGWDYGRRRTWETHMLFGLVPRYVTDRLKVTMTLREAYTPFSIKLTPRSLTSRTAVSYQPLSVSLALSTVFDRDFWTHQPERYPHGYYWFSTRVRTHFGLGQRLSHTFTRDNRFGLHGYTFYFEVTTTELDIIYKVQNSLVPLRDILHFGAGVKLQLL